MSRPIRRTGRVLAVLLLIAPALAAQTPRCRDSDTIAECWSRFFPRLPDTLSEEVGDSLKGATEAGEVANLSRKNNGIASLGDRLASAVSDFLPSIAGALGFTQATTEEGAASFEKNLLLPFGAKPQRFRVRALLQAPALYVPLADTLAALGRNDRVDALDRKLRDYDDITISLAWNLENGTFGRSFEEFRGAYSALLTGFVRGINDSLTQARNQALRAMLVPDTIEQVVPARRADPVCADPVAEGGDPAQMPLDCLEPAFRAQVMGSLEAAAAATAAAEADLARGLREGGYHEFSDLIDNQPQFSVEASTDIRRDLVGPNTFHATVRYEGGFANVNGLRQHCRSDGFSPACLRGYLESPGVRPALRRGDRFFVQARFSRRSDFSLTVPSDTLSLSAEGTWDLTGTAGFGRYVAFDRAGEGMARVDLAAEYIHHHDDPERQNRLVLTGTYTQRLSGSLSVAAGFSYSNRPEFVGDVDKKVSANFGLRYKLTQD